MTKQEAIKELELIKAQIEWEYSLEYQIAFDMAIKALQQEPKRGKWVKVEISEHSGLSIVSMRCNQCGRYAYLVLPKGTKCVYDYCPNCGARMESDGECC